MQSSHVPASGPSQSHSTDIGVARERAGEGEEGAHGVPPRFLAVVQAANPATPPPTINTFAGGMRPAAVIWPAKNRSKLLDASMTARCHGNG